MLTSFISVMERSFASLPRQDTKLLQISKVLLVLVTASLLRVTRSL